MDLAYKTELEELNEKNFDRFRAEIRAVEARLEGQIVCSEARLDKKIGTEGALLRADMAGMRAELIKWMFLFWAGTAATVIGVMSAVVRAG